jgi:hypothetical protein
LHRFERVESLPPLRNEAVRLSALPPVPVDRLDLTGIQRIWVFQSSPQEREGLAGALAPRGFVPAPQPAVKTFELKLYERKEPSKN